jgi:diguanylate cyclase (GGDEF)-like protein
MTAPSIPGEARSFARLAGPTGTGDTLDAAVSAEGAEDDGNEDGECRRAYMRAYELVVGVQTGMPGAADEIAELLEEVQRRRWPEAVRVAMFASAVAAGRSNYLERRAAVARLLAQAEEDDAPVMVALALAMRSGLDTSGDDPQLALTADDDLARATVILETAEGLLLERISAHNACAQAYGVRWLWELCDEQYAAALRLVPDSPAPWARCVLPAIVYNRAEMQVNWACVHRQLGEEHALGQRWETWETVMTFASASSGMPREWAIELEALGHVLAALVGDDVSKRAGDMLERIVPESHPGAWPAGWLQLATALSDQRAGRLDSAAKAVEQAVTGIDPRGSADPYDLALFLAAELEAGGRLTAAMRYARRELALRWSHRLALHSSTLGRIQAERLRREHDVITQQAHLDDLTALLNRRGFSRYVESLARQDVGAVSLLVADLDNFKSVNDRYGHQLGDMVLVSVGRLLHAHVRQSDCAVRLGGDEFAVVLASTGVDVARRRAEALVAAVRAHPWQDLAPGLQITASVGLASGRTAEFTDLIQRADRALYQAKRSGRDTVVCDLAEPVGA